MSDDKVIYITSHDTMSVGIMLEHSNGYAHISVSYVNNIFANFPRKEDKAIFIVSIVSDLGAWASRFEVEPNEEFLNKLSDKDIVELKKKFDVAPEPDSAETIKRIHDYLDERLSKEKITIAMYDAARFCLTDLESDDVIRMHPHITWDDAYIDLMGYIEHTYENLYRAIMPDSMETEIAVSNLIVMGVNHDLNLFFEIYWERVAGWLKKKFS